MTTQIINNDEKSKNNAKYDNLKKGASLMGAAVAGAGAMYGADNLMKDDAESELDVPVVDIDPTTIPSEEEAETSEEPVTPIANQEQANSDEPAPQDSPTVNTQDNTHHAEENATGDQLSQEEIDLIATNITSEDMIDNTDIDHPNLDIASIGSITTADGQEIAAAQIINEEGDELYLVDIDHDNIYDYMTDATGNIVNEVGTLSAGDAETILSENQEEAGFLANNGNDGTSEDLLDGIENDIMNING